MKKVLIFLFVILYLAVGFVSTWHAISFFSISNTDWLAVILAITFEVGQGAVLFSMLVRKDKSRIMPWALMGVLTMVQVIGNIFASYQYMMVNSTDIIKYFTDSVLFFVADPNPQVNKVILSYITGAILPIVALCMTGMVVDIANDKVKIGDEDENGDGDKPKVKHSNKHIITLDENDNVIENADNDAETPIDQVSEEQISEPTDDVEQTLDVSTLEETTESTKDE